MICGLATHGCGADALTLFHQMKINGEKPDGITFIGVLCSCTHLGLVEEGTSYFNSMVNEYSITPNLSIMVVWLIYLAEQVFWTEQLIL